MIVTYHLYDIRDDEYKPILYAEQIEQCQCGSIFFEQIRISTFKKIRNYPDNYQKEEGKAIDKSYKLRCINCNRLQKDS